jgi:hypothetical protein
MPCTTNNTSNNDTLISKLEATCQCRNIEFAANNHHVRYLTHVINLAAQAALSKLKVCYVESESDLINQDNEILEVIPKVSS